MSRPERGLFKDARARFKRANLLVSEWSGLDQVKFGRIYPLTGKSQSEIGALGLFSQHPKSKVAEFGILLEHFLDPIYVTDIGVHEMTHAYVQVYNPWVRDRLRVNREGVVPRGDTTTFQALEALFHSETVASYAGFRVAAPVQALETTFMSYASYWLAHLEGWDSQILLGYDHQRDTAFWARLYGRILATGPERSLRDLILADPAITWNSFSDAVHKATQR